MVIPINGKKSHQIAKEYGLSASRVRHYAKENNLPYVSFDGGETVEFYVFDEEAEKQFANRRSRGRPAVIKTPKEKKPLGRPRKEKADLGPKRPVGRPRTRLEMPEKGPRGRPRKTHVDTGPKRPRGRPRKDLLQLFD